jgi:hypothetical protein
MACQLATTFDGIPHVLTHDAARHAGETTSLCRLRSVEFIFVQLRRNHIRRNIPSEVCADARFGSPQTHGGQDLVNRHVTLISAFATSAALAAKAATGKNSIVFAVDANPIEIGLVASLDHPGANIIGVAGMGAGRERKRLELLHAALPTAPVLGLLRNPQNSSQDAQINDALASAQKIGVQIRLVRASTGREFGNVFAELNQSSAGGSSSLTMSFFSAQVLNLAH